MKIDISDFCKDIYYKVVGQFSDHTHTPNIVEKNTDQIGLRAINQSNKPNFITTTFNKIVRLTIGRDNSSLMSAINRGSKNEVQVLIEAGADLEVKDRYGKTPLAIAIVHGNINVVVALIKGGADLRAIDRDGETLLILALSLRREEAVLPLIEAGADLEAKDKYGITPLLLASESGLEKAALTLIEGGADLEAKDGYSQTPLIIALLNGHEKIALALIKAGADLEAKDGFSQTPLIIALENGQEKVVLVLIEAGADLEVKYGYSQTPLFTALKNGQEKIALALIKAGADLEAKNKDGKTPLMEAIWNGYTDLAVALAEKGANIEATDNNGNTALLIAVKTKNYIVIKTLLARNVNLLTKNNQNITIFEYVIDQNDISIIELFAPHLGIENAANFAKAIKIAKLKLPISKDILILSLPHEQTILKSLQEPIKEHIRQDDYIGFIETLKSNNNALKSLYEALAQVSEGYTVGEHTTYVLRQYIDQKKKYHLEDLEKSMRNSADFENFDIEEFMLVLISFHDIGKSIGLSAAEQHIFTIPLISVLMKPLGFSDAEIRLAQTLVGNDVLGHWQQGKKTSLVDIVKEMTVLAETAGIDRVDYFRLQKLLFISDASSYPSIRNTMIEIEGKLKFKPRSSEIQSLTDQIEQIAEQKESFLINDVVTRLTQENFNIDELFNTVSWQQKITIFDIANTIIENEATLKSISSIKDIIAEVLEMAKYCQALQNDGYKADHTEWSVKHRLLLRKESSISSLDGLKLSSKKLKDLMGNGDSPTMVFLRVLNENIENKNWEKILNQFYLTKNWNCSVYKLLSSMSRKTSYENYIWVNTPEGAFRKLNAMCKVYNITEEQAREVFAALQAYTVEFLQRVDFPGKNPDGSASILRTEDLDLMQNLYDIEIGKGKTMPRSSLDCASLGACVVAYGAGITRMKVPFHRIVGGYFLSKDNLFGNPSCNGITFQPEGVLFDYIGKVLTPEEMRLINSGNVNFDVNNVNPQYYSLKPLSEEDRSLLDVFGIAPLYLGDKKVYINNQDKIQAPTELYQRVIDAYKTS